MPQINTPEVHLDYVKMGIFDGHSRLSGFNIFKGENKLEEEEEKEKKGNSNYF